MGVVDKPRDGVAQRAQFLQRGGEPRSLLDQNVQGGRDLVQCTGEHFLLSAERRREPVQFVDRGDDVVALLIQGSDEGVETSDQIANDIPAAVQRGVEVVDDVADLSESPAVDDGRK